MFGRTLNPALPLDATSCDALLAALTEQRGAAPAWHFPDTRAPLGFSTLVDEARRTAAWLRELGLSPGDRVAAVTDALEPFAIMALATAIGGFTLVPLPTTAAPSILASLLVRASPAAILLSAEALAALLPVFAQRGEPMPGLRIIDVVIGLLAPGLLSLDDGREYEPPAELAAPDVPPDVPLVLFYNNGSRGRAEAAAIGFSQLREGLRVTRVDDALVADPRGGRLHAVVRVPTTAIGALFDLWRPLVLGLPILDLSSLRATPHLAEAVGRRRPRSISLAVADIDGAFFAAAPDPTLLAPLEAARARVEKGLVGLAGALDAWLPPSLVRNVAALARPVTAHGVEQAWFFRDMPGAVDLARLRKSGVSVARSYQISECAVPLGVVSDADRAIQGYRVPAGVEVRVLDAGPDGVGEVAVRSGALAHLALDASRELHPIQTRDGFLPTGDLGRLDAAGRLHVLGTRTLALTSNSHTVTSEEIVGRLVDGPWAQLVPIPERLLWPEDAAGSARWVAIVHGAEKDAAIAFIRARNEVLAPHHRIHGVLCSPAAFPVGTHGRIRREALLGALRSAFAALAATPAGRARAIDWIG